MKTNIHQRLNNNLFIMSKTLVLFIVLTLVSVLGFSQETKGNTISITIENFTSNDGKALVALHSSDTFLKAPGIKNNASEITDGKAVITFENVTPGEYAILVLHDANNNGRMDYDTNGMPKESYGLSNNPRSFGPPVYNQAKFDMETEDLNISIRL